MPTKIYPQRRRSPRPRPFVRPRLESLESRALPSASTWTAHPLADFQPLASSASAAFMTPARIRGLYGIDQLPFDGAGQTIAIVDAYDDPNIASDLYSFDVTFGLPDPPSFVKALPQGVPGVDSGWAGETALDVEWAHAVAPRANILLVEAVAPSAIDLLQGVDYARRQPGVVAVSMSWGGSEFAGETGYDWVFTTPDGHPGVTFVASSGDSGAAAGPTWPSTSPNVLAVGGTTLWGSGKTYYGENAWSYGGGGYSSYEAEPGFQAASQQTGRRSTPDVAYDGDPASGFYVYNSVPDSRGWSGWFAYGGTSAGAPQWAALIALADQGRAGYGRAPLANAQDGIYHLSQTDFNDVSWGSNGYAATPGYDAATGRGTPRAYPVVRDLVWYEYFFPVSTLPYGAPSNAALGRYGLSDGLSVAGPNAANPAASLALPADRTETPVKSTESARDSDLWARQDLLRDIAPPSGLRRRSFDFSFARHRPPASAEGEPIDDVQPAATATADEESNE